MAPAAYVQDAMEVNLSRVQAPLHLSRHVVRAPLQRYVSTGPTLLYSFFNLT